MSETKSGQLESILKNKVSNLIQESKIDLGDLVVRVKREDLHNFFSVLKIDAELQFNLLVDVTAVDWLDSAQERFEIVYHFLSTVRGHRIRVKAWVPESSCEVESSVTLWSAANFLEREVWDMYGIKFKNHPDLRKILMYDEFQGHPLRKDYPVQGKQPRIPLRYAEVENTARLMNRGELVQIKKKAGSASSEQGKSREGAAI